VRQPARPLARLGALLLTLAPLSCAPASAPSPERARHPETRAERTHYTETSSYAEVMAFLDTLEKQGAPLVRGTLGTSPEGRTIPYVIASRPKVGTVAEARALGRPIVYVQGNIHGGEVEGKEALLALLRELSFGPRPNALDSIVLIAVPIYNTDGNEALGPQAQNRSEQNGPELVGRRANGQNFDLNRDYMKAEAPETRGSLALINEWDPDVFVDLHTTNGSYHGYAVTYAPPLAPVGEAAVYTRERLLPELRRRMRERHALETFDYGNFSQRYGADLTPDTTKEGWFSYEHLPRYGVNYIGVRDRVAILSEAFSHDPFEKRVRSTYAFVQEILSLSAERGDALRALRSAPGPKEGDRVALRSELTRTPFLADVIAEDLALDPDSVPDEPGVPRGIRRTGRFRTVHIPVHDRFTPTLERSIPAGWALAAGDTAAVARLKMHGVRVETLRAPVTRRVEAFTIDAVIRASRAFQGHHEVRLAGRWQSASRTLPAGSFWIPAEQPLGLLAAYLLEPESDDGFAAWSSPAPGTPAAQPSFGRELVAGTEYPVVRGF
jgi:murein tripeptide amidase MpaA